MENKKVLILVNHEVVIYNFRLELVERLIDEGYEVFISSPYGERIDDLINLGCRYIQTSIERHGINVFNDLKLLMHYKRIIADVKPSIVLTYTIKPNIYGGLAAKSLRFPYIANITGLGSALENDSMKQKFLVLLYRLAFKDISCIFFQNVENMKFFRDHNIEVRKHRLIPGSGVNLYRYRLLDYPSGDTIHFAFISRIMKEKGIDEYIEAAVYIKKNYPKTVFHVCGFCEEPYEYKLKSLQKDGIIKYHGMVRNVASFLKGIHCTVHPTYYPEGISNVLLESAASGKPIITTNRSGCREVVDDGVNGFLVELKNIQDLIEKIERFIKLDYEVKRNMGLVGRKKVENEFDRQIVVQAYMDEIENATSDYKQIHTGS